MHATDDAISDWLCECQSPIETALGWHLARIYPVGFDPVLATPHPSLEDPARWLWRADAQEARVEIWSQRQISRYRVDFQVLARFYDEPMVHSVVIECDGHDYHERTKEQARADRSRDRKLTALGHTVIRFTGSEIHRDAFACAEEVEAIVADFLIISPEERLIGVIA